MLELTNTINAMVDQLNGFISEVTRVARVEHVMTNFSAALRFTPNGGDDHDTVDVSVADTGMGIHPTDIDSIFGRFYRTRIAVDTAIKGSGLGLAISEADDRGAERQDPGDEPAGTRFDVHGEVARRESRPPGRLMGDNGSQTVLVADDDPDLVGLVARRLVRPVTR